MLSDLLVLNRLLVLLAEASIGDRHLVNQDVKERDSFLKGSLDVLGDLLSLSEQLLSVVLRDDGLGDLPNDRVHYFLSIGHAKLLSDLDQLLGVRLEEHSDSEVDLLQVLVRGGGSLLNEARSRLVDERLCEERDS